MTVLDINHALEIMKTAFPYMDGRAGQTIELLIKAGGFYECLLNQRYKVNKMDNSTENKEEFHKTDNADIISMLKSVRKVCYENELAIIDSILNVINAMELYETYTNLFSMMSSQDDFNGFGSLLGLDETFDNTEDLIELLSSMLSPEDKETIENINMVLKMMTTTSEADSKSDEPIDESEDNTSHNF